MARFWPATLVLGFALSVAGCGGADGKFPVAGNVTMKGAPLASGAILFETQDGSQRGGTTITDGKFSLPAAQGLLPGEYIVRVSAVESQAATAAPAGPPGPEAAAIEKANKQIVPDEFNAKSTVKHEVGPGKPTQLDIAIP